MRPSSLPPSQHDDYNSSHVINKATGQAKLQEKPAIFSMKNTSHRFLYRAAEHQNSFEVEVVLPGNTVIKE
ncbi:hypothetical protein, conserved [Eimeria tenella]|uniref:Uncharacterized protein n=1 Tax=Eimeria tenella TaxID=5802 RepID=U6KW82_EIMTE|nr:hypothetical protein, conserved [Eimeria tenella]CDJ42226.1 hypothetical protein, conserved [Eimeria tenella]|eukprot:XP_013232976.1 hypothetical protein, conserved [Eimeria tenella]